VGPCAEERADEFTAWLKKNQTDKVAVLPTVKLYQPMVVVRWEKPNGVRR
jgi:hypothetical protein